MKDQYGNKVPRDLVVLDLSNQQLLDMTDEDRNCLELTDWFQPRNDDGSPRYGIILVSAEDVEYVADLQTSPEDAGVNLDNGVDYIDGLLKRWTSEDGFFHT